MCHEENFNSITRLVIFIFLILYLVGYKQSFLFLILSLIFIIILYYLQKNKMTTQENYIPIDHIKKSEKLYRDGLNQYKKNRYTIYKYYIFNSHRSQTAVFVTEQDNFTAF
jgi:5-bromo-4-chloroindolyl phosphate hydrolysis protein